MRVRVNKPSPSPWPATADRCATPTRSADGPRSTRSRSAQDLCHGQGAAARPDGRADRHGRGRRSGWSRSWRSCRSTRRCRRTTTAGGCGPARPASALGLLGPRVLPPTPPAARAPAGARGRDEPAGRCRPLDTVDTSPAAHFCRRVGRRSTSRWLASMISTSASTQVSQVKVSCTGSAAVGWCCDCSGIRTSEWAPQPWSNETAWPSLGDEALAQTPNEVASAPPSRTRKPQEAHGAGAACAIGDAGPLSPSNQRSAASSRPSIESTRSRPSPSSRMTSRISRPVRASSASSPTRKPGTRRGSSSDDRHQVARAEVALGDPVLPGHPRSVPSQRPSPGSRTISLTVTASAAAPGRP